MAGRLIALEKNPGIHHIAMEKYCDDSLLISVAKGEAQETCGIDQLCGGLQAGKEGVVHAMHSTRETQLPILRQLDHLKQSR